jgi:hypothetical protein
MSCSRRGSLPTSAPPEPGLSANFDRRVDDAGANRSGMTRAAGEADAAARRGIEREQRDLFAAQLARRRRRGVGVHCRPHEFECARVSRRSSSTPSASVREGAHDW